MLPRMETTEAWQLTTADFDAPDVGTVWDLCLSVEYDRGRLVADIADWIGPPAGLKVLDAPAAAASPRCDLHRLGYGLTCTDGSPIDARALPRQRGRRRNRARGELALWQELSGLYPEQFDAVICRGCSLTYAGTFDADVDPDRAAVEARCAASPAACDPGARLQHRLPPEEHLSPNSEAGVDRAPLARVIDGHRSTCVNGITADPATRVAALVGRARRSTTPRCSWNAAPLHAARAVARDAREAGFEDIGRSRDSQRALCRYHRLQTLATRS